MLLCVMDFVFLSLKIMLKTYNIWGDVSHIVYAHKLTLNLEKSIKGSTEKEFTCSKWGQADLLGLRDQVGGGQALIS